MLLICLQKSEIIINPEKSEAITLDRKKSSLTNIPLTIDNQAIKSIPLVELLGIHLDDKLKFNLNMKNIWVKVFKNGPSKICGRQPCFSSRSDTNQPNALIRFKSYLSFSTKKNLIKSHIIWNSDYCPLVWIFSTAKSLNKIEQSSTERAWILIQWLHNTLWRFIRKSREGKN